MTEEVTARQDMTEPEACPQCAQTLLRVSIPLVGLCFVELDLEVVVCISIKIGETVRRDFILKVDFRDWCAEVVRVELLAGGRVV